ncbi:10071_t:CDS:1, partial [Paraglomus brasilianum]
MQGVLDGPPILQCLSFWGHAIHTAQDVVQLTTVAMELVKKLLSV